MKRNLLLRLLALTMLVSGAFFATSCNKEEVESGNDTDRPINEGQPEGSIRIGGNMEEDLTLEKGNEYWLEANLNMRPGTTLTIEEGVTVWVSPYNNPEIVIHGNMFAWGTEAAPILFTLPEAQPEFFQYGTVNWGGINGAEVPEGSERPDQEIGMTYVTIQYAGGPMNENSEAVRVDKLEPGELGYSVFFNNNKGKLYMENCTVEHSGGDAIYIERGQIALFHNTVAYAGTTEDEAFNFKQGTVGDCGFNLMYSAATNGIKINNSKPTGSDSQTNVNMYNNTMAYCGWRRDGERGGSINIEKNAKGRILNNLIVNSKFGTKVDPSTDIAGENTIVKGNYYFGHVESNATQGNGYLPHHGIQPYDGEEDDTHVGHETFWRVFKGTCNFFTEAGVNEWTDELEDPQFAEFADVTPNVDGTPSQELDYKQMDFRLKSTSPGVDFGTDDETLLIPQVVTQVGEVTVNRPQPSATVGAFGSN
ncbi:hypothetical protein KMW28_17390 [Flammeovirga yaeyamensis]|uniref:Right handed beta helix domain-containing protein n=1 Tax=Flammeovirga yaeyamensis TaxID=367791 RepID=A0AAX1N6I8_9BACT|nr:MULTISPECIES: hypothetical protein [Flammeovirga]ANQ51175.1 hypothetical protein MY04_3831 [Flammeovirga sp. MY04]MBB3698206.1 hypothetical protein [Flammeovirga yaeyamensis]NMF34439.1 hypothetical protein [Flammeovirga yaeyamensis]QWG01418.1 hypothetical protein KMW28_17390 [Flammeovirga yaeyamensis]